MHFSRGLARWFPVPKLLVPHASGVDITDGSVKWMTLKAHDRSARISSYGSMPLPQGAVMLGGVRDTKALTDVLKEAKKRFAGPSVAHAALPEEAAYVFSMHVPNGSGRHQIMSMIEFELETRVPIPTNQAVYDYDTIYSHDDHGEEIAVTVFPKELAEGYVQAFVDAGIELVSMEIEARSIGRAISGSRLDPVTLLVDCGRNRTGVAILKHGIPIFTSTIDMGGDHMSRAVADALKLAPEEIEPFKNEQGLVVDDPAMKPGVDALEKVVAQLAGEIARHYRFWDTRRNEAGVPTSPVERVLLLGGAANLKGFPEYVAGKVHVPTERPNVWRNVASFDDYIPPLDTHASFQYATTVGLALRSL